VETASRPTDPDPLFSLFLSDARLTIDTSPRSPPATSLDAFRSLGQARDRFLPGGLSAVTLAAQGGLTGSASDYMRLAQPVRDPDNGDPISGSGKPASLSLSLFFL